MNKEKKHAQETQAKASDEMTQAENKVEDLNKIKAKLEVTLDELEDSYEREKKARLELDKQRRKSESELTVTQEEVSDLEREKKDIEMQINKKDQDIAASQRKLEDECSITAKLQKTLKEMQGKVEVAEEVYIQEQLRNHWISCYFLHQELEAERQARCKAEKQRGTLARELDDLGDRLEVH